MTKRTRLLAVLLVVLFAVSFLLSAAFMAVRTGHHACCGEGCAVCAVLSLCDGLLRGSFLLLAAAAAWLAAPGAAAAIVRRAAWCVERLTPVRLRVKLSD